MVASSSSFREFVIEQLGRVVPSVRARNMFGGVGIYSGTFFFALIAQDVLYFKVDDETRETFTSRGMKPFRPYGEDGETMGYYEVPSEVLDNPDELRPWAERAIAAAQRKRASPRKRRTR